MIKKNLSLHSRTLPTACLSADRAGRLDGRRHKESMNNNLKEKIKFDLNASLKGRRKEESLVLRGLLSALYNEQIKIGKDKELTEQNILAVLTQEAKKRKEAITLYEKGNRPEKAENEKQELKIIKKYLPAQLSETELLDIIKETIIKTDAQSMAEIGKIMGAIMNQVKDRADGSKIKTLVENELKLMNHE